MSLELPTRQNELQAQDKKRVIQLKPGEPYGVDKEISTEPKTIAKIDIGAGSFEIIDLRGVEIVGNIKQYNGVPLSKNIDYLLIDPLILNIKEGVGFKGIRQGESVTLGRVESTTDPNDPRMRFKSILGGPESMLVSRKHFEITNDDEGLKVTDLNSTNGTKLELPDKPEDILEKASRAAGRLITGRELSLIDVDKLKESMTKEGQPLINSSILSKCPELTPNREVVSGNLVFYFGPVISFYGKNKEGEYEKIRDYAIAFLDDKGVFKPRLFYKSNSEGGWRSCPGVDIENGKYRLSKDGGTSIETYMEDKGGYVQLTKPSVELSSGIDRLEKVNLDRFSEPWGRIDEAIKMFDLDAKNQLMNGGENPVNTFQKEVSPIYINVGSADSEAFKTLYESYEPGKGFVEVGAPLARERLENMVLPKGFMPDFKHEPVRVYEFEHTIAEHVVVRVYSGLLEGREVEWHMAHSDSGSTWVESIRYKDVPQSSYGTPTEVILAGALSGKPFEYESACQDMELGVDYSEISENTPSKYVSLQKTWDRMPPIKEFKKALGIN